MRIVYVRVRDKATRHEFDMPANHPHITKGFVELVKQRRYPPATVMRRPKHHLRLAPASAARDRAASPEATVPTTAIEETQHG